MTTPRQRLLAMWQISPLVRMRGVVPVRATSTAAATHRIIVRKDGLVHLKRLRRPGLVQKRTLCAKRPQ